MWDTFDHWITRIKYQIERNDFLSNSAYLFSSTIITSIGGLLFWLVAARLYSQQSIGIATSIISGISLIILITRFGFNQSLIRFLPKWDENSLYSTIFYLLNIAVLIGALLTVFTSKYWLSGYQISLNLSITLVVFALASSICGINSQTMIAKKKPRYFLFQNALLSMRPLFLPMFLIIGGVVGVVLSITIAYVVASIFSMWLVLRMGLSFSSFDRDFFQRSLSYSGSNYIASLFNRSTSHILPLMMLNILGPKTTAIYYITQTTSSVLEFLPQALSTSLFVEGSHGRSLKNQIKLTIIIVTPIISFASVVVYLFGSSILSIFDSSYGSGADLLFIFTINAFFVTIFKITMAKIRVGRDNQFIILLSGLRFALILGLSYMFINWFGLVGVGFGHLVSYCFLTLLIGCEWLYTNKFSNLKT